MFKFTIFSLLSLLAVVSADIEYTTAVVVLQGTTENSGISGTITFEKTDSGIHVKGTIDGLSPGNHGFHVHEKGDVSGGECGNVGAHLNPYNKTHGDRKDEERHVGDLGNINAGADGVANIDFTDDVITLNGKNGIVGKAVVVHEGVDDLGKGTGDAADGSKTTGNAGPKQACGVVGVTSEKNGSSAVAMSMSIASVLIFANIYSLLSYTFSSM